MSSKCSDAAPRAVPAVARRLAAAGLVAAAAATVVPAAVQAQVNRCTGDDGRVRYTDRPCASLGLARDAEASRRLSRVQVQQYDVGGLDGPSLEASLAARGPGGFHGLADWEFVYDYRVAPTPEGRCRVTGVRTGITGRILVPRWTDEAKAPPGLRAAWQRYLDALMRHEEGHIANGQSLTRALAHDIGGATGPDCKTLRADIDAMAGRLIDDHQARDRRYDAETGHGATQGARFTWP